MTVGQFSRVIELRADPGTVWSTITDVTRLVAWVSILHDAKEVEPLSRYSATLRDRLGPFKLTAELDIVISDVEEGRRLTGRAEGEDRQVGSRISVQLEATLDERDGGTSLGLTGSYEVAGRIATMGNSMITKKAEKILDEFFSRVAEELG